jgi:hypothetical protein
MVPDSECKTPTLMVSAATALIANTDALAPNTTPFNIDLNFMFSTFSSE